MSLKGWWCATLDPFGVDGGTHAHDLSGSGKTAALVGATFNPDGANGGRSAISNGYADFNPIVESGDITIDLWRDADSGVLIGNAAATQGIYQHNATTIRVNFGSVADFTVPSNAGGWNHIRIQRVSGTLRCYYDGTESSTGGIANGNTFTISRLGGDSATTLVGRIDDIRIDSAGPVQILALGRGWQPAEYAPRFGEVGSWSASINDTAAAGLAYDNVGSNHGTLTGGLTTTADTDDRGLRAWNHDGTDDEVTLVQSVDFGDQSDFSISAWCNWPGADSVSSIIGDSASQGLSLWLSSANLGQVNLRLGGSNTLASVTPNVPTGQTFHLVAAIRETAPLLYDFDIYINGSLAGQTTSHSGSSTGRNYFNRIGNDGTSGRFFTGRLDSVRTFSRSLLAAEVLEMYEREGRAGGWDLSYNRLRGFGTHAPDPYIIGDYPTNDSTTDIQDFGPFARNLTADNGPTVTTGPKLYIPESIDLSQLGGNVLRGDATGWAGAIDSLQRYTMIGWARRETLSADENNVVSFGNDAADVRSFQSFRTTAGANSVFNASGSPLNIGFPTTAIWEHHSEINSGITATAYLRDADDMETVVTATASVGAATNAANNKFLIGARSAAGTPANDFAGKVSGLAVWARALTYLEVDKHAWGPPQLAETLPTFNSPPTENVEADVDAGQGRIEPRLGVGPLANGTIELRCYWYIADDENGTNQQLIAVTILPAGYTPASGQAGKYLRCETFRWNGGTAEYRAGYDTAEVESTKWLLVEEGVAGPIDVPIGAASETDTAAPLAYKIDLPIGIATETDSAEQLGPIINPIVLPISPASETDLAWSVAVVAPGEYPVGVAQSVESAQAVTIDNPVPITLAISPASTVNFALSMSVAAPGVVPIAAAVEGDTARAVFANLPLFAVIEPANESSFANKLTTGNPIAIALNPAASSEVGISVGILAPGQIPIGLYLEADFASQLIVNQTTLAPAQETDIAYPVSIISSTAGLLKLRDISMRTPYATASMKVPYAEVTLEVP